LWLIFLARVSMICLCLTSSSVAIAKLSLPDPYCSNQLTKDQTKGGQNWQT
jgi:hypothetical protein